MLAVVGNGHLGISGLLETVQPVERKGKRVAHAGNDKIAQRQAVAQRGHARPEQIQQDHVFRPGILHVFQQFLFHIKRIGHDHHGPGLDGSPEGNHGLGQIGQHDGHPLARLHAHAPQGSGKEFRPFAQIFVGNARVLEDQGVAAGVGFGGLVQQGVERLVPDLHGTGHEILIMGEPGPIQLSVHGASLWRSEVGGWNSL